MIFLIHDSAFCYFDKAFFSFCKCFRVAERVCEFYLHDTKNKMGTIPIILGIFRIDDCCFSSLHRTNPPNDYEIF